ncbi:acyltransferase [Salinibius halmophilus]|uniref:acyltransferase n=1 Tax=Salinibius halmophilus TaxID=1853216 RepID=UPI001314E485|nr:acyltransferase [Salinibius halmophilus]
MKKINLFFCYLIRISLIWLPDLPALMRFRGFLYGFFMGSKGRNLQVAASANIRGACFLSVGNNVYIGPNAFILARHRVVLEDEVMLAMNTVVVDTNHKLSGCTYRSLHSQSKPVVIGCGSWIAANSVVLPGAVIGRACLVAAVESVRGELPDKSIFIGGKVVANDRK